MAQAATKSHAREAVAKFPRNIQQIGPTDSVGVDRYDLIYTQLQRAAVAGTFARGGACCFIQSELLSACGNRMREEQSRGKTGGKARRV